MICSILSRNLAALALDCAFFLERLLDKSNCVICVSAAVAPIAVETGNPVPIAAADSVVAEDAAVEAADTAPATGGYSPLSPLPTAAG